MSDVLVLPARERVIPATAVLRLYREQGWWPERTAEQVSRVLADQPAVGAWLAGGSGGAGGNELVGFARAVSDGAFRAYLEDVVVAERHRRRGIGRALVDALRAELAGVQLVSLFCGPSLVPFYEAAGYHPTHQVVLHDGR
jgi:GNAT superfamily N-acetyltransferase